MPERSDHRAGTQGRPTEGNRGPEELQGKLLGSHHPFFLYNQSWKSNAKLFFTDRSQVSFSELPIAGTDTFLNVRLHLVRLGGPRVN